jgi:hypothetical protein
MGVHTESGDLLSVLDELDTDTLSDGRVGLLGLNSDLLKHDSLGVRRSSEGGGLEGSAQKSLLEALVGPSAMTMVSIF